MLNGDVGSRDGKQQTEQTGLLKVETQRFHDGIDIEDKEERNHR